MKNNNQIGCLYIIIGWVLLDLILRICIWGIFDIQISFTTLAMMSLGTVVIGVLGFVLAPIIWCFFDKGEKKNPDKDKSINEVGDNKGKEESVPQDADH